MTQNIITAGDASNPISISGGNDGTVVIQSGLAGAKVNALSFAADGTPTFLKGPVASMVRLNTANGYGSTNIVIRRFTNVITNQGTDITYVDSATLGATFTINTSGVYSISYSDSFTASAGMGISLNSTQLTTAVTNINVGDKVSNNHSSAANTYGIASACIYLVAGSVIRPHTDGIASGTSSALFTITRVA